MAESKLKDANENPWYVLATIYGEQDEDFDTVLHEKNRRAWNRWALKKPAQNPLKICEFLKINHDLHIHEIDQDEIDLRNAKFRTKFGSDAVIPEPTEVIDFSDTVFEKPLVMQGFYIPKRVLFRNTKFSSICKLSKSFFDGPVSIHDSLILGRFECLRSKFQLGLTVSETKVMSRFTLHECIFGGQVEFLEVEFHKFTDFRMSNFPNGLEIQYCEFHAIADFNFIVGHLDLLTI